MGRQEDFDKFVKNTADTISHQWGTDGLTYADLVDAGDKCVEYGYQYAVDKACKYFMRIKECDLYEDKEAQAKAVDDFINRFRKAMQ